MRKRYIALGAVGAIGIIAGTTACASDADVVSQNISKQAEMNALFPKNIGNIVGGAGSVGVLKGCPTTSLTSWSRGGRSRPAPSTTR